MPSLLPPADRPQNLSNHRAIDTVFVGTALALMALAFAAIYQVAAHPSLGTVLLAMLYIFVAITVVKARVYATKVQTRVVRLEMMLRLREMLDAKDFEEARTKLTIGQIVALRFASDAELPALLRRAIDEKLSNGEIKKAIKDWQADWFRV